MIVIDTASLAPAALRRVAGAARSPLVCLDESSGDGADAFVETWRYTFYHLERAAMELAEAWAVGAVDTLRRRGALRDYHGIDLGPLLSCWLYYRLLDDAAACVRLARVLEVEDGRVVSVVTRSPLRGKLYARVLAGHGVASGALVVEALRRQRAVDIVRPVARGGRDLLRLVNDPRRRARRGAGRRLLFIAHHPTVRPRARSILAELLGRGWEVAVVNTEGRPAVEERLPLLDLTYRDFLPRRSGVTRMYGFLMPFRARMRRRLGDLPGAVAFPAAAWRSLVLDCLYTVLTEIEVLSRIVNEVLPDVLMYSNRGGLGTIAGAVGRKLSVPTVLVQLTESWWDEDFRYCCGDLFTVMGPACKDRFVERGASSDRVVVTGSDHYHDEVAVDRDAARAKLFHDLGLEGDPKAAKIVLFASAPKGFITSDAYRRVVFESVVAAAATLPEIRLVVKLHPRESDSAAADFFGQHMPPGRFAVTSDYHLPTLLETSDAVLILFSTVGLQAVIRDRPVIVMDYKGDGLVVPVAAEGAALCAEEPAALPTMLREALYDDAVREGLRRQRHRFLAHHVYPNDGRAAERIADATEQLFRSDARLAVRPV